MSAREASPKSVELDHGDLKVTGDGRFLVHADGTPFFWLGDTAWELFHRSTREEAEKYLENRRSKRFTVIQAVALAEIDGLNTPNAYGHRPLVENDPARPDLEGGGENDGNYWDHVDFVVDTAGKKGILIGLLPTWGSHWHDDNRTVFTPENAHTYGKWLGLRYRDRPNIIWVLGGDRVVDTDAQREVLRKMAAGLAEGDGGRHLKTFHPRGGGSSSEVFHGDDWLDLNMIQSGHGRRDAENYGMIAQDYAKTPVKPCTDGEPRYEDHPVAWKPERLSHFVDFDCRQAAYWALFAGAHGHTYGHHGIWQWYDEGRDPVGHTYITWPVAIDRPGAFQMTFARALMESRPMLERVPDQSIVASGQEEGAAHLQATRGDGYLFVYTPTGKPFEVRMDKVSGPKARAWWYDPRTGEAEEIGVFEASGTREFVAPGVPYRGNDWALVLDDASKGFPAPGTPA